MSGVKFKQLIALTVAVLMIVTGLNLYAIADETRGSSGRIVSFEQIPDEYRAQELPIGASFNDIQFPKTITTTVEKEEVVETQRPIEKAPEETTPEITEPVNPEKPVVEEPVVEEPVVEEPVELEPGDTSEPPMDDGNEPADPENPEPSASEPTEPETPEPVVTEPVVDEPVVGDPEPSGSEPATLEPASPEPASNPEPEAPAPEPSAPSPEPETPSDSGDVIGLFFPTLVAHAEELQDEEPEQGGEEPAPTEPEVEYETVYETITKTETVIFENLDWEIDSARSTNSRFDSSSESTYVFVPEISWFYSVNCELPVIIVHVGPVETALVSIEQSVVVDGVKITVKADEGVFPEGTTLSARRVTGNEEARVDQAVEAQAGETKNVISEYTFDITMLDSDGNEIQPDTSKGSVNVSFETEEVGNDKFGTDVYHIDDSMHVDELDVQEVGDVVQVETEGFSYYKLSFFFLVEKLTLDLSSRVENYDIAEGLGLNEYFNNYTILEANSSAPEKLVVEGTPYEDEDGTDHLFISITDEFEQGETVQLNIRYDHYYGWGHVNVTLQNHEHDWVFTHQDDSTLQAECSEATCDVRTHTIALVRKDKDYDGEKAIANFVFSEDFNTYVTGYTLSDISYYVSGSDIPLGDAPIELGDYVAKATLTPDNADGLNMSVSFSIVSLYAEIQGNAEEEQVLTVDVHGGTADSYIWYRDSVDTGCTDPTYTLSSNDIGHRISVKIIQNSPADEYMSKPTDLVVGKVRRLRYSNTLSAFHLKKWNRNPSDEVRTGDYVTFTPESEPGYVCTNITLDEEYNYSNSFSCDYNSETGVYSYTQPAYDVYIHFEVVALNYSINKDITGNGTVSCVIEGTETEVNQLNVNNKIVVTLTPDEGYYLKSFKVKKGEDTVYDNLIEKEWLNRIFTMPASDVTLEVEFAEIIPLNEETDIYFTKKLGGIRTTNPPVIGDKMYVYVKTPKPISGYYWYYESDPDNYIAKDEQLYTSTAGYYASCNIEAGNAGEILWVKIVQSNRVDSPTVVTRCAGTVQRKQGTITAEEVAEAYTINYHDKTISVADTAYEIALTNTENTIGETTISVADIVELINSNDRRFYIRKVQDDTFTASPWYAVQISLPTAPNIEVVNSETRYGNGAILGFTTDMEYRLVGEQDYISPDESLIDNGKIELPQGDYNVRIKYNANKEHFAGIPVCVTIGADRHTGDDEISLIVNGTLEDGNQVSIAYGEYVDLPDDCVYEWYREFHYGSSLIENESGTSYVIQEDDIYAWVKVKIKDRDGNILYNARTNDRVSAARRNATVVNGAGGKSYSIDIDTDEIRTKTRVELSLEPEEHYGVKEVIVVSSNNKNVEVLEFSNTRYVFYQPSDDVTVTITYEEKTRYTFSAYVVKSPKDDEFHGRVEITDDTYKEEYYPGDVVRVRVIPDGEYLIQYAVNRNITEFRGYEHYYMEKSDYNEDEGVYYLDYTMQEKDAFIEFYFFKFVALESGMVKILNGDTGEEITSAPCIGDKLVLGTEAAPIAYAWYYASDLDGVDVISNSSLGGIPYMSDNKPHIVTENDIGKEIVLVTAQINLEQTEMTFITSEKTYKTLKWSRSVPEATSSVTPGPIPGGITYNGSEQPLIAGGTTQQGKIVYSDNKYGPYTDKIPTAKDPGTYEVWWKIVVPEDQDDYRDTTPRKITVTINKKSETTPVTPSVTPTPTPPSDGSDSGSGGSYNSSPSYPTPTPTPTPTPKDGGEEDDKKDADKDNKDKDSENDKDKNSVLKGLKKLITGEDETSAQEEGATEESTEPIVIGSDTAEAVAVSNRPVTVKYGNGAVEVAMANNSSGTLSAGLTDAKAAIEAILSDEVMAMVQDGSKVKIKVETSTIKDENITDDDKAMIDDGVKALKTDIPNIKMADTIDISLYVKFDHDDWNAVPTTRKPIEIAVGIPEADKGLSDTYYILRLHEGETTLLEDLDEDEDTITIGTNQFSTYTILYEKEDDGYSMPYITGDSSVASKPFARGLVGWIAAAFALLLVWANERAQVNAKRRAKRRESLKKALNHTTFL